MKLRFNLPAVFEDKIKIEGGTPEENRVLTSTDNQGNAEWKPLTEVLDSVSGLYHEGDVQPGQITFWTTTPPTVSGNNNLFWDNTNSRLGIGTNTPTSSLQINSYETIDSVGTNIILNAARNRIMYSDPGTPNTRVVIGSSWGTGSNFSIITKTTAGDLTENDTKLILLNNGNVGIGKTNPGTELDVNGTITATGGTSTNWNTAYTYSQTGHLPLSGGTLTGKLNLPASITDSAYLNLPHGLTPTTLVNGDFWTTTTSLI
ncbi:hypothetical protein KO361_00035, partial [Candidatus Woesearchaeota archaeon]|nr:hypothetical protein [Candidatus Woesearchaeota archaeon]